jgi:hypothetical protein
MHLERNPDTRVLLTLGNKANSIQLGSLNSARSAQHLEGDLGTASPRYWASLDPQRPKKSASLILDGGRYVRHVVTPEDPDAVEAIIREHVQLGRETDASEDGPLIRLAGAVSQYESRP